MSKDRMADIDECEYCGTPVDEDGAFLTPTPNNGLVCQTCFENKPWKY
jgi:hypothetical protein